MSKSIDNLKHVSGKFGYSLGEWVLNHKILTIVGSLALIFGLMSGAGNLGFDGDYRVFFKKDNPQRLAYEELERKYTQDDNILIVVEPENGEIFTKENLAAIEELTASAWQTPFSSRVDAINNFQHTYSEEDDLFVEDLVDGAENKNDSEIAKIKRIAISEPLLVNRIINKEGSVAAINITVKLPGEDPTTEGPSVIKHVREQVALFETEHPNLKTHLSGLVMLNGAFFEASMQDNSTLIPMIFWQLFLQFSLQQEQYLEQ